MKVQSRILDMPSRPSILWLSIGALAMLQASFTFSWVVYRVHLPAMTQQFGFAETVAPMLLTLEALLAIAIEPLAGQISDQWKKRYGNRFPLIFLGIVASVVLLLVLVLWAAFVSPTASFNWLLPILLVAWSVGMSLFRTPALSLLKQFATTRQLPQAASLLTLAAGLAGSAEPLGSQFLKQMGTTGSFLLCAVLLVGSTVLLRTCSPADDDSPTPPSPTLMPRIALIFVLGAAVTFAFRLFSTTLPKLLKVQVPGVNPPSIIGMLLLIVAIAAIPAGKLAIRWGNQRLMFLGIAGMAICFAMITSVTTPLATIALTLLLGTSFSLISNGTLPLVLSMLTAKDSGFAVGTFFGGVSLTVGLFGLFPQFLTNPSILVPTWIGYVVLAIAALVIALAPSQWQGSSAD